MAQKNIYAGQTVERLIQEHAIYKQFYEAMRNRITNNPHAAQLYPAAKMFDVIERLEGLDAGIPYYDPAWADADKELFAIGTSGG